MTRGLEAETATLPLECKFLPQTCGVINARVARQRTLCTRTPRTVPGRAWPERWLTGARGKIPACRGRGNTRVRPGGKVSLGTEDKALTLFERCPWDQVLAFRETVFSPLASQCKR